MTPDDLSPMALKALVIELVGRMRDLERQAASRDTEIARLKALAGRPPGPRAPYPPDKGQGVVRTV
jgi:hypothetical protein